MILLHHDKHYLFRFGEPRQIDRFHLEGMEVGMTVSITLYDCLQNARLDLLCQAEVGIDGWVTMDPPLLVDSVRGFVVEKVD